MNKSKMGHFVRISQGIDISLPFPVRRILAIHTGGIGDVILFTPALRALRDKFPDAFIVLLVGRWGAEKVVQNSHLVDEVLVYDNRWSIFKKIEFVRTSRKMEFDLTVTATGLNPLKGGMFTYFIGATYRAGEDTGITSFLYTIKTPYDKNMHEVNRNLNIIRALGAKTERKDLFISVSKEDRKFADTFLQEYRLKKDVLMVGIHPGSGIYQPSFRRWPKERFAEVCDMIIQKFGAKIIIFGGPKEVGLAQDLKGLMRKKPIITAGKTTLGQAAALIEKCKLFVTNDSGLMHIACAVGIPVVAIFGPTNYKKTAPWSDSAIIVRKDLDCSPCAKKGNSGCKAMKCFDLITVEDVMSKVRERL